MSKIADTSDLVVEDWPDRERAYVMMEQMVAHFAPQTSDEELCLREICRFAPVVRASKNAVGQFEAAYSHWLSKGGVPKEATIPVFLPSPCPEDTASEPLEDTNPSTSGA